MTNKDILTVTEAAELLGYTKSTTAKYAQMGIIKGFKFRGQWRFNRDDLIKFLRGELSNE